MSGNIYNMYLKRDFGKCFGKWIDCLNVDKQNESNGKSCNGKSEFGFQMLLRKEADVKFHFWFYLNNLLGKKFNQREKKINVSCTMFTRY